MKTVTRIQTFDGQLHDTPKAAQRHLDVLYGNVMCPLVGRMMAHSSKYAATCDFINDNLDHFQKLLDIKADMKLVDDSED